jgi:hypothetical protein
MDSDQQLLGGYVHSMSSLVSLALFGGTYIHTHTHSLSVFKFTSLGARVLTTHSNLYSTALVYTPNLILLMTPLLASHHLILLWA